MTSMNLNDTDCLIKESFPSCGSFVWGMTLLKSGTMRFRWNEHNERRIQFVSDLVSSFKDQDGKDREICQAELIHSKKVIAVNSASDCKNALCDGIVTDNPLLIPCVTVADCMPVFMCEPKTGVFGVLHSGWKGTGIIREALLLCRKTYGTRNEDFYFMLGPHIRNCCYNVDKERAEYFKANFTPSCISLPSVVKDERFPYALSLEEANLSVLKECNVPLNHVSLQGECTCCTRLPDGNYKYGSNRRETKDLPRNMPVEERGKHFTVQNAFIICGN